jgi:hypothetical protein
MRFVMFFLELTIAVGPKSFLSKISNTPYWRLNKGLSKQQALDSWCEALYL